MSVNFLIVGAQKAGTTTLHHYLSQHPNIFCHPDKELHHFDHDQEISVYLDKFKGYGNYCYYGECTPIYMCYPWVPNKILRDLGKIKIIIILRDPISRAYSHYWHEVKLGWETLPFQEALLKEKERIMVSEKYWRHYSYIARGHYKVYIDKYVNLFGRENVCIVEMGDLVASPVELVSKVIHHLDGNLTETGSLKEGAKNISKVPRSMLVSKVFGALEKRFEGNYISKAMRFVNLQEKKYPKLDEELKNILNYQYFFDSNNSLYETYGIDYRVVENSSIQKEPLSLGLFEDYWLNDTDNKSFS